MILIYSLKNASRLQYICGFIFNELLTTQFSITQDEDEFNAFSGVKINYSNNDRLTSDIQIIPHGILEQSTIVPQIISCFKHNQYTAFFKTTGNGYAFDIFAACFYLISRYEEYLPHKKDMYGRYAHENSMAYQNDFLHLPIINIWVNDFANILLEKNPTIKFSLPNFNFVPTYDIDIAYSYKSKGLIRNMGGFIKSPSINRLQVLFGIKKDPFDCYDWLESLHNTYQLQPIYFFLVAEKNVGYDKNILPSKSIVQKLIQRIAQSNNIGIHPSWQSGDDILLFNNEIKLLENISNEPVTSSRQHYIRFNLPDGYQRIVNAGITNDYSMGYGSINGFRASTGSAFNWYNLKEDKETSLRIHPFCYMEANSFYEQKNSASEALQEMQQYLIVCKENGCNMITIWHNHFLGSAKLYAGWKSAYETFIRNNFGK